MSPASPTFTRGIRGAAAAAGAKIVVGRVCEVVDAVCEVVDAVCVVAEACGVVDCAVCVVAVLCGGAV